MTADRSVGHRCGAAIAVVLVTVLARPPAGASAPTVDRLVGALLGETPLVEDLRQLTDEIGGRPTGSAANAESLAWALARFQEAGVEARREAFTMPALWLERSAAAWVGTPDGEVGFEPRVAAMTFSMPTSGRLTRPLVDAGRGREEDFARLGEVGRGAFALVETDLLEDVAGLFREYAAAGAIERRAIAAGVAGLVYMGSRPRDVLYRQNAWRGPDTEHPMVVMERTAAERALRLLRAGRSLELGLAIEVERGGPYEAHNVVGEIRGAEAPGEVVVVGAHIDSWGLGTGALDNGCNVALLIDVARQIRRLGLTPRRTLRFVLFNGEEQGLHGSWGYTRTHADELDRHVLALSVDIGSGRIAGFFTGGREELVPAVEKVLLPVSGLGPFEHPNVPIVGTDNYDFMMQGVANLVAAQESANYGPNYHAATDTFDKVDQRQLRLNAAIVGALVYGFADVDVTWERQTRAELEALVAATDLEQQMRTLGLWKPWVEGRRGRRLTE